VGTPAKNQYVAEPENTIKSIKRKMGTDVRIQVGEHLYTPQEISSFILRRLKEMAEAYLGEPVERAVITVPAYFSDAARQATKDAGEIAELEVMRIINEPTAAALAYGLDQDEDQFLIVYDLGGGTFDVSVIEINSGVMEVRASHGNTQLGGDDFDQRIIDEIAGRFEEEHSVDLRQDRKALARLTRAAEKAKIDLSDRPFTTIAEEFIITQDRKPLHLKTEFSRQRFEELINDLLDATVESITIALDEAKLSPRDITNVLLVGGSTRVPAVVNIVEHRLSLPPHSEISPELCVAMGASVQGAIIAGEDIDAVLVDVAPHSLGISVVDFKFGVLLKDQYSVVIRRNTTIPTSKSEVYSTIFDSQPSIQIKVYQGEEKIASANTLLGEFLFEGIPPAPAGVPEIVVTFDYDVNGIVHVTARDRRTKKEQKITVEATPERLTVGQKEEAQERTASVWRKRVQDQEALALIEKARRVAKERKRDERTGQLLDLAADLSDALEWGETEAIEGLKEELSMLLYEMEE
jgi:molecular chaperone DnaK